MNPVVADIIGQNNLRTIDANIAFTMPNATEEEKLIEKGRQIDDSLSKMDPGVLMEKNGYMGDWIKNSEVPFLKIWDPNYMKSGTYTNTKTNETLMESKFRERYPEELKKISADNISFSGGNVQYAKTAKEGYWLQRAREDQPKLQAQNASSYFLTNAWQGGETIKLFGGVETPLAPLKDIWFLGPRYTTWGYVKRNEEGLPVDKAGQIVPESDEAYSQPYYEGYFLTTGEVMKSTMLKAGVWEGSKNGWVIGDLGKTGGLTGNNLSPYGKMMGIQRVGSVEELKTFPEWGVYSPAQQESLENIFKQNKDMYLIWGATPYADTPGSYNTSSALTNWGEEKVKSIMERENRRLDIMGNQKNFK